MRNKLVVFNNAVKQYREYDNLSQLSRIAVHRVSDCLDNEPNVGVI